MERAFKVGDWVQWNSEAGRVHGRIVAVHEAEFLVHGYRHQATPENPQYAILNPRTGHVAYHRPQALVRIAPPD